MNNNAALNVDFQPDERSPRHYIGEYGAQVLLGFLFLTLVCYTGTLVGAFSGQPHLTALILTCSILVGLCIYPSGPQGAPRFVSLFWKKFEKLPTNLLLPLAAWLICDALATLLSSITSLSNEVFGSHLWFLLIAALIYSYAGRGILQVLRMAGAMIVGLDAVLIFGVLQYLTFWTNPDRGTSFHAQHFSVVSFLNDPNAFGHFLAMVLPLTLWDAARAHSSLKQNSHRHRQHHQHPAKAPIRKLWTLWRIGRAGLALGLSAATTSRSNWLAIAIGLAFMTYLLVQRQKAVAPETPVDFRKLVRPYRASLIVGLVLVFGIALQQNAWFRQRLTDVVAPQDFGNSGRGAIWRNSLRLALKRPAFGWGPGTFAVNYPQSMRATDTREVVLQAHNTYLNRFVEEGFLALLFWTIFVTGLWRRGLLFYMRRPDSAASAVRHAKNLEMVEPWMIEKGFTLLPALLTGVLAYGVAGFFVMSEQIPTMMVYFYGYLALIAALVFNDDYRAFRRPGSQASPLARALALTGGLAFVFYSPNMWRTLQAQLIFDESLTSETQVERVSQLREARNLDPDQPVYWGQLGLARYHSEGRKSARSIANLFRAAANRSPSDAVWWHNTAMLYLLAGDSSGAIRNELRATKYDPSCSFFQATLADAYELGGDPAAAASRRRRANVYSQPPVMLAPREEGGEDSSYFCAIIGARYRRVVHECEIIKPDNYTRTDALSGANNTHFYQPQNAAP